MKKYISLIVFLSCFGSAYPQNYDLIVTTDGDSIDCQIDSITNTHIYFEMKISYNWTRTNMDINNILEFKKSVLEKNAIHFKPGTSILIPSDQVPPGSNSLREIPKSSLILANDFLFSITLNYERLIPIHEKIGFMLRGGTGITFESGTELVFMGQVSMLVGRTKHFFETGVGYYQTFNASPSLFPLIGYRYMEVKGLTLKAHVRVAYYTDDEWAAEWGRS